MRVTLEWYEMLAAATIGVQRKIECVRQGKRDAHGLKDATHDWTTDIEGALAEIVVAKALNKHWNHGVNTWKAPDIEPNIQVRLCKNPQDPHMVIRPDDDEGHIYILVTWGEKPNEYIIHGAIYGSDARKPQWWSDKGNNRPPAWFVPASELEPLERVIS